MSPLLRVGRDGQLRPVLTDAQRRRRKQREHGRDTAHWRSLSKLARSQRKRCAYCGTSHKLTTHLDPSSPVYPNHENATLGDVIVACLRCHGRVDGPRAQGGVVGLGERGTVQPAKLLSTSSTYPRGV